VKEYANCIRREKRLRQKKKPYIPLTSKTYKESRKKTKKKASKKGPFGE